MVTCICKHFQIQLKLWSQDEVYGCKISRKTSQKSPLRSKLSLKLEQIVCFEHVLNGDFQFLHSFTTNFFK